MAKAKYYEFDVTSAGKEQIHGARELTSLSAKVPTDAVAYAVVGSSGGDRIPLAHFAQLMFCEPLEYLQIEWDAKADATEPLRVVVGSGLDVGLVV